MSSEALTPTSALDYVGSPEWRERGREQLRKALATGDLRGAFTQAGMLKLGPAVLEGSSVRPIHGRPVFKTVSPRSISRLLRSIKVVAAKAHFGDCRRFEARPRERRIGPRPGSRARSPGSADPSESDPPRSRRRTAAS